MKVSFFGAAKTVTGSKHLVETQDGVKILLDCGMFQGGGKESRERNSSFGFNPAEIDVVVLSHAHIDHSGLLPKLVADGFKGKIFCTASTHSLCEIMLNDSAHIQKSELKYVNRRRIQRHEEPLDPLYDEDDVARTLSRFVSVRYHEWVKIHNNVSLYLSDTGHILGSASVTLKLSHSEKHRTITFTGDIGRRDDAILRSPERFPASEVIICESTYGNRKHGKSVDASETLLRIVNETCVLQKGRLVIPAFSIDRTQELIYILDRLESSGKLPPIPVFIDSPLSVKATMIMKEHEEDFNPEILEYIKRDGDAFGFKNLHYITDVADSKMINASKQPCVIISASGMAEAGRIKHHIAHTIEDARNTILIVGYCTPGSLGGALRAGAKEVGIFGERRNVRARIEVVDGFSAHADSDEMIDYLKMQDTDILKKIFLVHGESEVQSDFKLLLMQQGFTDVVIPDYGETFTI